MDIGNLDGVSGTLVTYRAAIPAPAAGLAASLIALH
jgi:hypothetical protein